MTISVTLRITGAELEPQKITSLLSIAPTISREKGAIRISSTGKEIIAKTGLWTWKTADAETELSMSEQIEELRSIIQQSGVDLKNLPGVENVWLDVCVVADAAIDGNEPIELFLDEESIAKLYVLGLPVEISIYSG